MGSHYRQISGSTENVLETEHGPIVHDRPATVNSKFICQKNTSLFPGGQEANAPCFCFIHFTHCSSDNGHQGSCQTTLKTEIQPKLNVNTGYFGRSPIYEPKIQVRLIGVSLLLANPSEHQNGISFCSSLLPDSTLVFTVYYPVTLANQSDLMDCEMNGFKY